MSVTEILAEIPKLKEEDRKLVSELLKELEGKPRIVTGADLAKCWTPGSYLSPEEADAFAQDIAEGRKIYKPYVSPWE